MAKLKNKWLMSSLLLLMASASIGGLYVYGEKSVDYSVDEVQIETIFMTEQEVLKEYSLSAETEDIPQEISMDDSCMFEEDVNTVENLTYSGLNGLKIEKYFKELKSNNSITFKELECIEAGEDFVWPVTGYTRISSPYGWRICPFHGKEYHSGIDIPAPAGTSIKSSKSGVVVLSEYHKSYGNYVIVEHYDGGKTLYAHMKNRNVTVNQKVKQGQTIGYVGSTGTSTGNHLHYEVWTGSENTTRVNPMNYF